jgi:hypothetical protein
MKIEELLGTLHTDVAEYFLRELQKAREDDTYVLPPSFLSALTKFLKDNDITATPEPGTAIASLKEEINNEDREYLQLIANGG